MLQFYFLAVFLNVLAGYILLKNDSGGVLEFKSDFSLTDETFKLVIGILCAITGLFKLLSPIEGDVPVVGDLIPAVCSFLSGFILIFEYLRSRSSLEESEQAEKIDRLIIANKKIIGVAAIVAAGLHFLFPKVLLL